MSFKAKTSLRKRNYANNMFLADFVQLLAKPRNRFQIIDLCSQLFDKLQRWAQPSIPPRQRFSLHTINANHRADKIPSYPMKGLPGTYVKFQGLLDTVFGNSNPLKDFTPATDDYNFVADSCGLHTGPVFPFTGDLEASDASVIASFIAGTEQDYETAWNTLLIPAENALGFSYKGLYKDTLTFPAGQFPYIRATGQLNDAGDSIFRLSPDQPDTNLITTDSSTGDRRKVSPSATGPFISAGRIDTIR